MGGEGDVGVEEVVEGLLGGGDGGVGYLGVGEEGGLEGGCCKEGREVGCPGRECVMNLSFVIFWLDWWGGLGACKVTLLTSFLVVLQAASQVRWWGYSLAAAVGVVDFVGSADVDTDMFDFHLALTAHSGRAVVEAEVLVFLLTMVLAGVRAGCWRCSRTVELVVAAGSRMEEGMRT